MSDLPGYDFAIQGLSGLMSITGPVKGPPCKVGVAVTDVLTALYAAVAVLACLNAAGKRPRLRHRPGPARLCRGRPGERRAGVSTSGEVPPRQGNAHLQIVPYQAFATADDWLILAVGNDGQWQRFCQWANDRSGRRLRFVSNGLRVRIAISWCRMLETLFRTRRWPNGKRFSWPPRCRTLRCGITPSFSPIPRRRPAV